MEVTASAAQSPGINGVPTTPFPAIEPEKIIDYLALVCQSLLGATRDDLEQSGSLLHQSRYTETVSRCLRFATDNHNVLYIQKDIATSSAVENGADVAGKSYAQREFLPRHGLLTCCCD